MVVNNSRLKRERGPLALVAVAIATMALIAAIGLRVSASDDAVTVTTAQPASVSGGGDVPVGFVSDVEMREALDGVVACVAEAGYEAKLVDFAPGLSWRIDVVAATEAEAELANAAVEECSARFAGVLDAYAEQSRLGPVDQATFETLVRDCLDANGVQLDENETKSLAARVPLSDGEQFTKCQADALERVRR